MMISDGVIKQIRQKTMRAQILEGVESYFARHPECVRFIANNAGKSSLIRYRDNVVKFICDEIRNKLSDITDNEGIVREVRSVVMQRINAIAEKFGGNRMSRTLSSETLVSGLARIASKELKEDDVYTAHRLKVIAQTIQGGDIFSATAPEMDVASLTGKPQPNEEEIGQYDVRRKPKPNMYDVQLLRVMAYTPEEAQTIVEEFIDYARKNGQQRISVGTITKCRDTDDDGQ